MSVVVDLPDMLRVTYPPVLPDCLCPTSYPLMAGPELRWAGNCLELADYLTSHDPATAQMPPSHASASQAD
jgi:hypothetical protein